MSRDKSSRERYEQKYTENYLKINTSQNVLKLVLKSPSFETTDDSGGHIESDISNIDIFVNIDIVSKQMRKYQYFDI